MHTGRQRLLIKFFSLQANIKAFVPKVEIWQYPSGYTVQELLSDLVFIKSNQNKEMIERHYKAFFKSIQGFDQMLAFDHIYALNAPGQALMDQLFGNDEVIRHSVSDQQLHVIEGPLQGLEKWIIRFNENKKQAVLDFMIDSDHLTVPLEIMGVLDS